MVLMVGPLILYFDEWRLITVVAYNLIELTL